MYKQHVNFKLSKISPRFWPKVSKNFKSWSVCILNPWLRALFGDIILKSGLELHIVPKYKWTFWHNYGTNRFRGSGWPECSVDGKNGDVSIHIHFDLCSATNHIHKQIYRKKNFIYRNQWMPFRLLLTNVVKYLYFGGSSKRYVIHWSFSRKE